MFQVCSICVSQRCSDEVTLLSLKDWLPPSPGKGQGTCAFQQPWFQSIRHLPYMLSEGWIKSNGRFQIRKQISTRMYTAKTVSGPIDDSDIT